MHEDTFTAAPGLVAPDRAPLLERLDSMQARLDRLAVLVDGYGSAIRTIGEEVRELSQSLGLAPSTGNR